MSLLIKNIFLLILVNNNYYFLLPNADLLKISVFIFFHKTYKVLPSQKDGGRGNKVFQLGEDHFLNFWWGEKSKWDLFHSTYSFLLKLILYCSSLLVTSFAWLVLLEICCWLLSFISSTNSPNIDLLYSLSCLINFLVSLFSFFPLTIIPL